MRVSAFSFLRCALRAASHSSRVTTLGRSMRYLRGWGEPQLRMQRRLPARCTRCPSCRELEVGDLRIEGALEGPPGGAALDVGGEALVAGDDVRVLQDAKHR